MQPLLATKRLRLDMLGSLEQIETGGVQRWDVGLWPTQKYFRDGLLDGTRGENWGRAKPPDMPGMLMVKNRGKKRWKTGENRAETGHRRRKPGVRQTRRSRAEPGF